jgi:hypothetical protein
LTDRYEQKRSSIKTKWRRLEIRAAPNFLCFAEIVSIEGRETAWPPEGGRYKGAKEAGKKQVPWLRSG